MSGCRTLPECHAWTSFPHSILPAQDPHLRSSFPITWGVFTTWYLPGLLVLPSVLILHLCPKETSHSPPLAICLPTHSACNLPLGVCDIKYITSFHCANVHALLQYPYALGMKCKNNNYLMCVTHIPTCNAYSMSMCLCLQKMTKPKSRPCPHCQVANTANRKTCLSCFASLSQKKKSKEESDWGENTKKHHNAGRVIDSARIYVSENVEVLGYCSIQIHTILARTLL